MPATAEGRGGEEGRGVKTPKPATTPATTATTPATPETPKSRANAAQRFDDGVQVAQARAAAAGGAVVGQAAFTTVAREGRGVVREGVTWMGSPGLSGAGGGWGEGGVRAGMVGSGGNRQGRGLSHELKDGNGAEPRDGSDKNGRSSSQSGGRDRCLHASSEVGSPSNTLGTSPSGRVEGDGEEHGCTKSSPVGYTKSSTIMSPMMPMLSLVELSPLSPNSNYRCQIIFFYRVPIDFFVDSPPPPFLCTLPHPPPSLLYLVSCPVHRLPLCPIPTPGSPVQLVLFWLVFDPVPRTLYTPPTLHISWELEDEGMLGAGRAQRGRAWEHGESEVHADSLTLSDDSIL